jgi:hypothetical protein
MGSIHRFMDVHSMEAIGTLQGMLQDFEKDMPKTASKTVH